MDGNAGRRKKNPNPPEGSPDKKIKRKNASGQDNQGETSASSLADRLVELWKAGPNFPPVFTQETADNKLKLIEAKCTSLEGINNCLQARVATSEAKIVKLSVDLKNEADQQQRSMNTMTTIWDYMQNVTETINYVTETLDECKAHTNRLTTEHTAIISEVYADNETLKSQAEQLTQENHKNTATIQKFTRKESELAELKPKYQILNVKVESYERKLQQLGEDERRLQKKIVELEAAGAEERRKLELMCASEREKLNQQRQLHETEIQKVLKEAEGLKEKIEKLQEEKNDVFRLLAEKKEEIQNIKKAADHYKSNVEKLQVELNEKTASYQLVNDEKVKCGVEIQKKNRQISQLTQELEILKLDLSRKTQNLSSADEAKRNLEQEIVKKELQSQETEAKFRQVETEGRRQVETLQQSLTQKTAELQDLQNKWKEADSEKESIKAELSKSTLLLQAVQKENGEITHKLTLISSTKQFEVGDLKYQLENLTKQLEEKKVEFDAEKQEFKLKYVVIEQKYENEIAANKENCENFAAESTALNAKIQKLEKLNEQYLEEKERINTQFNSSEQKVKRITKADEQLKEKLEVVNDALKSAEQTIEKLNQQKNQQLDAKNKELVKMEKKLKTTEQKAVNFQQKCYDIDANLNEKIRNLQKELDAAKLKAQEANDQRSLVKSESFQRHQKNLEASEKRAHEFEEKYYALQAQQETERQNNYKMQKLLEESQMKAQEFEQKHRNLELQGLEFNRKISTLEHSLQDPQILSPSSWKKCPPIDKKVNLVIRSDQTFPAGTIEPMLPPKTPKTPRLPPKSILKSPITPVTSPRVSPVSTPRSNGKLSLKAPPTPKSSPKTSTLMFDEPPRSSSPDSSMISDEFDMNVKSVLDSLAEDLKRSSKSSASQPKGGKKFFKSRNSQPK